MNKTIEKSTDIQNSLVEHKKCSKCKRIYPSASVYFYKNKNRKMGLFCAGIIVFFKFRKE